MSKQNEDEEDDSDEEEFGSNDDFLGEFGLSEEDSEFLGDPLQEEKRKERDAERVKKILIAQGYQEDELETMFPDTEKMVEFYNEQRRGSHTLDAADIQTAVESESGDTGPEPEDDYELDAVQTQSYLPKKPVKAVKSSTTAPVETVEEKKPVKDSPNKKKKPKNPNKGEDKK